MLEFYKDTEFQSYCRGTPETALSAKFSAKGIPLLKTFRLNNYLRF